MSVLPWLTRGLLTQEVRIMPRDKWLSQLLWLPGFLPTLSNNRAPPSLPQPPSLSLTYCPHTLCIKTKSGQWVNRFQMLSYCINKHPPNPVHIKICTGSGTCWKNWWSIWNMRFQRVVFLQLCCISTSAKMLMTWLWAFWVAFLLWKRWEPCAMTH